jgi:hypothetical protein
MVKEDSIKNIFKNDAMSWYTLKKLDPNMNKKFKEKSLPMSKMKSQF